MTSYRHHIVTICIMGLCLGAGQLVVGCSGEIVGSEARQGADGSVLHSDAGARNDSDPFVNVDSGYIPPGQPGDEVCNGFDDDLDGDVDEDCLCKVGLEQPCYPGPETPPSPCAQGTQRCIAAAGDEFSGRWGPCEGATLPAAEHCDGIDNNCNGKVDETCDCVHGETRPCSTACGKGQEQCVKGVWQGCDAPVPQKEVCDGKDNNCDGQVDEGCGCVHGATRPCKSVCGSGKETCSKGSWGACNAPKPSTGPATASVSPWQRHNGGGVKHFGFCAASHGDVAEFQFASIPAANDGGWHAAPNSKTIGYSQGSSLCGVANCRCAGDFTYFRTFVDIQAGAQLQTFNIQISGMDDGVRTTIFNSKHPSGITVPGGYVKLGGSTTANLASFVVTGGRNTIVLTHVDDCCQFSNLNVGKVVINGQTVTKCP